jgi:hypothetical protein
MWNDQGGQIDVPPVRDHRTTGRRAPERPEDDRESRMTTGGRDLLAELDIVDAVCGTASGTGMAMAAR